MYKMPHFTEPDDAVVLSFMQQHEFVMLTGNADGRSVATQVPVMITETEEGILLRGHIMCNTDHHLAFVQNPLVLVLFTGPHCFVSSSWYKERNIGGTWNYMTVHLQGFIKLLDDAGTLSIIKDLTHKYEATQANPELVEDMPADYINGMVKAIAGFEILAHEITPIFKLSQNRSDESYQNIISELEATDDHGSHEVAKEMRKRRVIS